MSSREAHLLRQQQGLAIMNAWKNWCESESGIQALNEKSLGPPGSQSEYLKNRLWHAFMEGVEVGKRIAK